MSVVLILGVALLAIGLGMVSSSPDSSFTWDGAVAGLQSQLSVTGPAALLVAAATVANVLVGAIVLRFLGTPAFRTLSDLIVAGFATAVVLDAAALFLLGSAGFFGWPELLALHAVAGAAYFAARKSRPLMATPLRLRPRRPAVWWLPVAAVWAGPLLVQLSSPAAPFQDVLPNHVAPIEHARVFGSFATLVTSPSPIYGPSRLMLGYVGLLGDLTTLANLEAILAVAAFAFPLAIITAISMRQLAARLFGASAGFWVLLTFPLTFTFMRLTDTRGTVVAFPLAAYALATVAEELRAAGAAIRTGREIAVVSSSKPDVALACALGGAVLVHPLVGMVAVAGVAGMLLLQPARLGPKLIPALGAGAVIAIPQVATMLGLEAPSWTGFLCLAASMPVAFGLAWAFAPGRLAVPFSTPRDIEIVALMTAAAIALIVARQHIDTPDDPASYLFTNFNGLLALAAVGLALGFQYAGRGWVVLGCGLAAGLAAWAASGLVGEANLTQQAIHYEVPKTIEYWLPVLLALGAAGGIAAVLRLRLSTQLRSLAPIPSMLGLVAVIGMLVLGAMPVPGPVVESVRIGQHRWSESVGLALQEAEIGAWPGYPDSRRIIDEPEQEVVDALRTEIDAGRLGPSTRVLHIASSFQQWVSVPIGVFTGAIETSISLQPELSIHTDGGRLLGFGDLDRELAGDYGYVVIEPAGLPSDVLANAQARTAAAGYRQIWSNSQATIFARR
jgi:hypothetical protein